MKEVELHHDERSYINVMESLVAQEVGRQLQDVPAKIRRYLKIEDIVTYALNRLPVLYASSEKGWQYQRQVAKRDLSRQIQDTVRQAMIAVQVDPLRASQPLTLSTNQAAADVLQELRAVFQSSELNWSTALKKLNELKKNPLGIEAMLVQNGKPGQPGQTQKTVWTHRHRRPALGPDASARTPSALDAMAEHPVGWDNVLYRL
jgi:hypothetical protein